MAKITIEIDEKILEAFTKNFYVSEDIKEEFDVETIGKERIVRKVIEASINERWLSDSTALEYIVEDEYEQFNGTGEMYDFVYEASLESEF